MLPIRLDVSCNIHSLKGAVLQIGRMLVAGSIPAGVIGIFH